MASIQTQSAIYIYSQLKNLQSPAKKYTSITNFCGKVQTFTLLNPILCLKPIKNSIFVKHCPKIKSIKSIAQSAFKIPIIKLSLGKLT